MTVTKDRVISIDYTMTDKENQCVDTTADSEPLAYLHGCGNLLPGLEQALEGKTRGDRIHITLPAAEAYGVRDEELVVQVPRENFDNDETVHPGMQFEARTSAGMRVLTVAGVGEDTITVDGNHPLAGLDLTFDITVTGVREASPEELARGHIHTHECGCGCDCDGCEECGA